MARVLITGVSGTGKSSVLDALRQREYFTVDTDFDDWVLADGKWDETRMDQLLSRHDDIVISGTVENQGRFYDRFQHVVLLSAPLNVILERVTHRTNSPYGKTAQQRAEIAGYHRTVEPLLRRTATVELDGQLPTAELADTVAGLVDRPG